jgi:hypothetical protein
MLPMSTGEIYSNEAGSTRKSKFPMLPLLLIAILSRRSRVAA